MFPNPQGPEVRRTARQRPNRSINPRRPSPAANDRLDFIESDAVVVSGLSDDSAVHTNVALKSGVLFRLAGRQVTCTVGPRDWALGPSGAATPITGRCPRMWATPRWVGLMSASPRDRRRADWQETFGAGCRGSRLALNNSFACGMNLPVRAHPSRMPTDGGVCRQTAGAGLALAGFLYWPRKPCSPSRALWPSRCEHYSGGNL